MFERNYREAEGGRELSEVTMIMASRVCSTRRRCMARYHASIAALIEQTGITANVQVPNRVVAS